MADDQYPETSYILNGLREFIIQRFNPASLMKDPKKGLAKKEELLKKITHEFLLKHDREYLKHEAQIAENVKDFFTEFLIVNPEESSSSSSSST